MQEQRFVQLVCEQTKKQKPDIVLHDSGVLVAQTIYGFDSSVMKKIEKFLREQKPELLHHQKFLENGTAERAKESGTEQNYNMIDLSQKIGRHECKLYCRPTEQRRGPGSQ